MAVLPPLVGNYWTQILGDIGIYIMLGIGLNVVVGFAGSTADAFGAYRHDLRPGEPAGIGRESEISEGSLAFYKGPYFVSIITLEETEASRDAMVEIGRRIDAAIPQAGTM